MRANMRNFSANNRGGKYASGGGYTPGKVRLLEVRVEHVRLVRARRDAIAYRAVHRAARFHSGDPRMRSLLSRAAAKVGGFFRSVTQRVRGSVSSAFQRSRSGSSTSGS